MDLFVQKRILQNEKVFSLSRKAINFAYFKLVYWIRK